MRRNVWSVDELAQILSATDQVMISNADFISGTLSESDQVALVAAYKAGFRAALISMAKAVGVVPWQIGIDQENGDRLLRLPERRQKT